MDLRPGPSDRFAIVGRTGSGKTQFGSFLLSRADLKVRPWIIFDYKREGLFASVKRIEEIRLDKAPPKHPGLYILRLDHQDNEQVENYLWDVKKRGHIGLFFDEGYEIPQGNVLRSLLTQGRSLKIPVIMLCQRPSFINRFVFSEMSFFTAFHLNDTRDRKTVQSFVDCDSEVWQDMSEIMPPFHSRFYDLKNHVSCFLKPCPNEQNLIQAFDDALRVERKWT